MSAAARTLFALTRRFGRYRPWAPISRRDDGHACDSDRYKEQYIEAFVAKWDELIDWDKRAASEGGFFTDALRSVGARTVLDVATGTGFHSISLLRAGFEVTSVDGSAAMLERARLNARLCGVQLRPVHADWRWLGRDIAGRFDAIVCLGNSFTHLFDEDDRRRVLCEYSALLAPGGLLILDQRNYDALLDHGARPSQRVYYCGAGVSVRPVHLDEELARFQYAFADGSVFHLDMFPLRKLHMKQLLAEAGFARTITFGDFSKSYQDEGADFLIHIARKTSAHSLRSEPGSENNSAIKGCDP